MRDVTSGVENSVGGKVDNVERYHISFTGTPSRDEKWDGSS
jgi:hypothetical protein